MPARLHRYDVPGHVHFLTISCHQRLPFFRFEELKQVVVDGLCQLRERFGICLIGYVVMPEHLHLMLYPHTKSCETPIPVSRLLHNFKQSVGFHGKQALRQCWRRHRSLGGGPLDDWALSRGQTRSIWTTRAYDFNVTSQPTLISKLDYMHNNPITRGLVDRAEDWRWSSYRYYALDDPMPIAMDWDGRWPIIW
jgi:putative transposase